MTVITELRWIEGNQFIGRAGDGPAVVLDTPKSGSGPSPMEIFLMGLAGCAGIDVVSILKKRRAPFKRLKITATGERADSHPRRYTLIVFNFEVYGQGVKPQDVQRAIELSMTKYCSAVASTNAKIKHTFRIVEDEQPHLTG